MVFSVLWPFFAAVAILGVIPKWRNNAVKDFMPKNLASLKILANKILHGFHNTTHD